MSRKILHILSQRPSQTGSGITLESLVRLATAAGWQQAAVVGVPVDNTRIQVGGLPEANIYPVRFSGDEPNNTQPDLNFPIPGMSDVMPYSSSVWSTLGNTQLTAYRTTWQQHLKHTIETFKPNLIHSNHIWLVSSLIKDVAPDIPVVTTCHATGLRQLSLTPDLADEVISGCRRNDHFFVLRYDHADDLATTLRIPRNRITLAGVGFRDEIFRPAGTRENILSRDLLYVGKFSNAKGLPQLLDAFVQLKKTNPQLKLHVAGNGSGPEAEKLRTRMKNLQPDVIMHGMLDQENLAGLMQRCRVCVLPSFYEGVPLVLVEAAACGCALVSTALPGVLEQIAPTLGSSLELVALPRMVKIDTPHTEDLPRFTLDLECALTKSLEAPVGARPNLDQFTWKAVFQRVESVWQSIS